MSSKEKPTLGGTRIKTRKRNIAAPLDPVAFSDAVVQIYLDNAGDLMKCVYWRSKLAEWRLKLAGACHGRVYWRLKLAGAVTVHLFQEESLLEIEARRRLSRKIEVQLRFWNLVDIDFSCRFKISMTRDFDLVTITTLTLLIQVLLKSVRIRSPPSQLTLPPCSSNALLPVLEEPESDDIVVNRDNLEQLLVVRRPVKDRDKEEDENQGEEETGSIGDDEERNEKSTPIDASLEKLAKKLPIFEPQRVGGDKETPLTVNLDLALYRVKILTRNYQFEEAEKLLEEVECWWIWSEVGDTRTPLSCWVWVEGG